MRDYLIVTRAIDPVELEVARMQQVQRGYSSGDKSPLDAAAYVTMQELATRIAHRNTGKEAEKMECTSRPLALQNSTRRNLHAFYRNVSTAAFEALPMK